MKDKFIYICAFLNGIIICDAGNAKQSFFYKGNGEAKISCNGSDVINIIDIMYKNYPSDCFGDACNLTNNDIDQIKKCNGNTSCVIVTDDMSPCIQDKGFYNVNYSCQGNVMHCDFEDNYCDFDLEEGDWQVVEAQNWYPLKDHTTGSGLGHYISTNSHLRNSRFRSELIRGSIKQCLTLYYYIRDRYDSIGLYIKHVNGTTIQEVEIFKPDNNVLWQRKTLSIYNVTDHWLVIEARSIFKRTIFAVDDISIINGDCEEIEDNGSYVYMEASDMTNNQNAIFSSPTYVGTGEMCFQFWYCMYGDQMGSLRVYLEFDNKSSLLFTMSGNKGRLWHASLIDILVNGEFKIIMEGQRGNGEASDIAFDDISLRPGNCEGFVQHQQNCNSVEEIVELNKCSNNFVSNIHVNSDPSKNFCTELLEHNTHYICNNSSYTVLCDVRNITRLRPSCFSLNDLVIEYTCTGNAKIKSQSNKQDTGLLVGVPLGILFVVIAAVSVVFIINRRCRPSSKDRSITRSGNQIQRQQTSPAHSINQLNSVVGKLDTAEGYTNIVTSSEQHEYQELTKVDDNFRSDNYTSLDKQNIDQRVYDKLASPTITQGNYYNVVLSGTGDYDNM